MSQPGPRSKLYEQLRASFSGAPFPLSAWPILGFKGLINDQLEFDKLITRAEQLFGKETSLQLWEQARELSKGSTTHPLDAFKLQINRALRGKRYYG